MDSLISVIGVSDANTVRQQLLRDSSSSDRCLMSNLLSSLDTYIYKP